MSRLRVKNVGPVTSGYAANGGFIDFGQVTVFIGSQGSGKSTVAKLFSTMSWLEKALFQGRVTSKYVTSYNRFVKQYCAYQNLRSYFRPESEVVYEGTAYTLIYQHERLTVERRPNPSSYRVPQIMYVPAERNFLSAVDAPDKLKGLPQTLLTFWEELRAAQRDMADDLVLPINKARFRFNKRRQLPELVVEVGGKPHEFKLSEASSGFQSVVPLWLVSRYLAHAIGRDPDPARSKLSPGELRKRQQVFETLLNSRDTPQEIQQLAQQALAKLFRNETFLNVVEEPEQNLFPESQRAVLYELLAFANHTPGNGLVFTTHSPYIISFLTLAIKAHEVEAAIDKTAHPASLRERLAKLVPPAAAVAAAGVNVYELDEHGRISRLPMEDGLPSDDNELNQALGATNARFSDLVELELTAENE